MARSARVGSTDDLMAFRAALGQFIHAAGAILDEAQGQVQRTEIWLKVEQSSYWKKRVLQLQEREAIIHSELSRKQQMDRVNAVKVQKSYMEEKQALEKARQLREEAQQKQQSVKKWTPLLEREASVFLGQLNRLRDLLEMQLPVARTELENKVRAIEAYAGAEMEADEAAAPVNQPPGESPVNPAQPAPDETKEQNKESDRQPESKE